MTRDQDVHPRDDLLVDHAAGAADPAVGDHLRGCHDCMRRVAELAEVAHLLREGPPELVPPPPGVWAAVRDGLDEPGAHQPAPVSVLEPAAAQPSPRRTGSRGGRVPAWWLLATAAAGAVLGGLGVRLVADPAPAPATIVARTSLDTLDTGRELGSADAVRVGDHLDLDVSTAALDAADGYLEVWLINKDLRRMVSIGVLRPESGSQRFAIDEDLIDQGYVIVDISREGFDDRPQHSGDSLARGQLAL